ncbi:hypothetical protein B0H13DRAFT_1866757 [Mycena leptocephala]|nr:hypothetical protein B0H13DRAFT_1866757 [Mycena leptocephala]
MPSCQLTLASLLLPAFCRHYSDTNLPKMARNSAGHPCALERHVRRPDLPFALQAHAFNIWLDRSCSCPLSLRFGLSGCGVDIIAVLEAVVPHRARWERLELYSLSPSHLSILGGPMPMLRYLDLGIDSPASGPKPSYLRRLCYAPSFSMMKLLRRSYYRGAIDVLDFILFASLRMRSNLAADIEPDEDPATGFIETFIVPALRSLEIPEQYLDADPIESLKRFISKSGCKLEELRITGQRTRPQQSYREAFPWIRNFSFSYERVDDRGPSDVEASS